MCIAIHRPKGAPISKRTLLNCWDNNSDGAGFMYVEDGKLVTEKGFMKWKALWKAIRPHIHEKDRELVIHFRIATSGRIDYDNCHPHEIHDGLSYVHNGIIHDLNDDLDKCDTVRLAEILKELPHGFIHSDGIMALIAMAVGGSKFIFMDNLGTVKIINEDLGVEAEGVWYSNNGFRYSYKSTSAYSYGCGGDYADWQWSAHSRAPYTPASTPTVHSISTEDTRLEESISSGFKDGQTFDPDMPEGMVDDHGLTIAEYEDMALAEVTYWMSHSHLLSSYAYSELCEIVETANDGEPIRHLVQEWIEVFKPEYRSQEHRMRELEQHLSGTADSILTSATKPAITRKPYGPENPHDVKALIDLTVQNLSKKADSIEAQRRLDYVGNYE
jgi:hypothetical protein